MGLGVGAITITGLLVYLGENPQTPQNLTYQEYIDLLKAYNTKIEYIKTNCDTDKRCLKKDGEARVLFQGITKKEDVVGKMNEWLRTEDNVFVK